MAKTTHFRRALTAIALALLLAVVTLSGCGASSASSAGDPVSLRIGYQKSSGLLNLLRSRKVLEKRFGDSVNVIWQEFPAGPQMLEALNYGSVDFGTSGEAPPVFAQAAGAPLLYVALERVGSSTEAIVVRPDSKLTSVAELKGKRVALNKASNVHYFLVRALEQAGLTYQDVELVFLTPADGRAAFESGQVDAWAIWDPFLTAAIAAGQGRVLIDGTGIVENYQFYFATRELAETHPEVVQALLEELRTMNAWAESHRPEMADFLTELLGLDRKVLIEVEERRQYGIEPISPDIVAYQQRIADTFSRIGILPQEIKIADAIWKNPSTH